MASSSSSFYIILFMYIDWESFTRSGGMLKYLCGRLPSTSSSVRLLNSVPLAPEAGLHLPDDQSDVHLPAAAVIATWPPAHSFSETGQLLSQSTARIIETSIIDNTWRDF